MNTDAIMTGSVSRDGCLIANLDHPRVKCQMMPKRLLVVGHAPSVNTRRLFEAVVEGASSVEIENVEIMASRPSTYSQRMCRQRKPLYWGPRKILGICRVR